MGDPISVCKMPIIFEHVSPSNFRTQGSFIRIKQLKNFRTQPSFVRYCQNRKSKHRSRVKISAYQSSLQSVLFLDLLFRRWLEVIHRAFHYVNLSNMCSKEAFLSINLLDVGFFIAIQSVRIYISLGQKPTTK